MKPTGRKIGTAGEKERVARPGTEATRSCRKADPPECSEGETNGQHSGGTECVAPTGFCQKKRSYHEATRKGIAIPGDRRSGVDKERREKDPRQATEGQNGSGARRSWKGQGGSAVHHKRSSGTFTGEGGESLPRFFYGRANRSIAYFPHSAPRGLTYYNSPLVCGGARSAPYRSNALRLKEPRE